MIFCGKENGKNPEYLVVNFKKKLEN